ncbi:MAG TPA: PQQ-binding-like beta-propeller repeat protein, partial [Rhodanobacteraceae bacterium]|nr:PQQ-binding-like beta-propeller repeat protein [Rhodanobacteraceae bacterium]
APLLLGGMLGAAIGAPLHAQDPAQWGFYSANAHATRYSPLAQIDPSNVDRLRVVWRHKQVDPAILAANPDFSVSNRYMVTPIHVDGLLYVPNGFGLAEAIDPKTGRTVWTQKPLIAAPEGLPSLMISKGIAYWGSGVDARLLHVRQQHLFALSPKTGEPIASFGDGGKVDLSTEEFRYKWNGVPVVAGDVVVLGSSMLEQDSAVYKDGPPGYVRAFDVRTGKERWKWSPVPREGDPATATWENEGWRYSGAGNVWSTFSADDELGLVYVPATGVTNDMYGGHRLGNDLYGSSVVALNAKTGERVWHFQTVHHDLFDYDLPAAPILIDITVAGRPIKALAQVTKHGFLFVLDRATGAPVWPIEERPVPKSTVPGEVASPTQPHPTKPPPYEHQGLTENDLIDFTPELRAEALELAKRYVIGPPFTPPSVIGEGPDAKLGTIQLAGASGGANWNGGAFDPETGVFYVGSRSVAFVADLFAPDPARSDLRYRAGMREIMNGPRGLPIMKPPYGRITAFDLNKGEQIWMVPNADGPRNHPALAGLNLPPLGDATPSAVIATKTLLFVTQADKSTPRSPANVGGTKFMALDKATGKMLWSIDLGVGQNGTPMTYQHDGKQYVVVAVGGTDYPAELVALALP